MLNILVTLGIVVAATISFGGSTEPGGELKTRAAEAIGAGNYDKAIELYTAFLKTDPDNREARFNRGLCYNKLNKPEDAEKDFWELCAANPRDSKARYALGNTYFLKKRYKDAFVIFEELAKTTPEPLCLLAAAHSAVACRMYGVATKYYRQARGLTEDKALIAQIDTLLTEAQARRPVEDKRRRARATEQLEEERFRAIAHEQAAQAWSAMDARLTRQLEEETAPRSAVVDPEERLREEIEATKREEQWNPCIDPDGSCAACQRKCSRLKAGPEEDDCRNWCVKEAQSRVKRQGK